MTATHLLTGRRAERLAKLWLSCRGLRAISSNYRCRYGEIDLIMRDRDCVVFIEVRCRSSRTHGGPLGSVTRAKQIKLLHTAHHFLHQHSKYRACPMRFDVIALTGQYPAIRYDWCRQAFAADSL